MNHVPVMLSEVLTALDPRPGELAVDCTLGAGGHAAELLRRIGPTGHLIGIDIDPTHVEHVKLRLSEVNSSFEVHVANFAGLQALTPTGADIVVADLGVSSMQIDDPNRGFSYRRDGPLDLRMDPRRGRSASELLIAISQSELATAFDELGDFGEFAPGAAMKLADVIKRQPAPIASTRVLTELILATVPPPPAPAGRPIKPWQLRYRPVACAFQALRILVNRELANLQALLRSLPSVLRPGGRAAIISFHSGEDRLVKTAFRAGQRSGEYSSVAADAVRSSQRERYDNPRSRSAKLRWAWRCG